MKDVLVFIVNENFVRAALKEVIGDNPSILICSKRCLSLLSEENFSVFNNIYALCDFSYKSIAGHIKLIKESLSPEQNVKIVSNDECCNELCLNLIKEFVDSDYDDTSLLFQNKILMKQKINEAGLPTYKYQLHQPDRYNCDANNYVNELISRFSLPIVSKPIDSTSSQGVSIIYSVEQFHAWCELHQSDTNFELCEYVDGNLYHCDSLIVDGEVKHVRIGQNSYPCHQISEGKNIGTIMISPSADVFSKIKEININLASAFKPRNGVMHMEVFERLNGELVILEVADRSPGGEMRWMYLNTDNYDIEKAHFDLRLGNNTDYLNDISYGETSAAWACFPCPEGMIYKLNEPSIESDYEITWAVKVGDLVNKSENLDTPKAGVIRMINASNEQLLKDYDIVKDFHFVE